MRKWLATPERAEALAPELPREVELHPGDAPIGVRTGTADVFAVRSDGLRQPLATLGEAGCAFPASDTPLLVVARLNSSLETVELSDEADRAAVLAGFVAALLPIAPEVEGADLEAFPSQLEQAVRRLQDNERAHRQQSIQAALTRSEDQLTAVTARITFSASTLTDPHMALGLPPLIEVLHHIGDADGFQVAPPTSSELRSSDDPLRLTAHKSGVHYRKVTLSKGWQRVASQNLLGGIVEDGKPTPVALLKHGRRYLMQRPGDIRPTPISDANLAAIAPVAYEFYAPLPADRPITIGDVLRRGMHNSRRNWLLAATMGLAVAVLGLITPLLTNATVGSVIPQGRESILVQVGIALLIAAGTSFVFTLVQSYAIAALSQSATRNMQSAMWDRLLALPASFFRNFSSGDLTVRVLAVDSLQSLVSVQVVSSALAAVFGLVNLVLMFRYSPALGVVASIFLLLTVIVLLLGIRYVARFSTQSLTATREANGFLVQLLRGVMKVRLAGAEGRMEAEYLELTRRQADASSNQTLVIGRITSWFIFATAAAPALFYTVIAIDWTTDGASLSTGEFLAFSSAYGAAFAAISGLSNLVSPIANAGPTLQLLRPIMDELPESAGRAQDPGMLSGAIELSNIEFRYTTDGPLILRGLSLSVAPGEMVALVGPSGAGKSTITRLLLGFDTPEQGTVSYDGRDLRDLDPALVRSQMGVVVQEGTITRGSIMRNILGSTVGDEQAAWQAANAAALADDIAAMPMKMQTIVDPANVSGGQAQRILLARALVRSPRILLLDEATSALDNAAQAQITQAMDNLAATRIVIAHRLSTIRAADRIVVINAGTAVETGTYDELIERGGIFADLVKRQVA